MIDSKEKELIEEDCLNGAVADENIKSVIKENGKYRIGFTRDELDDLEGYLAYCSNHEKSPNKQERWDNFCDRIEGLLNIGDKIEVEIDRKTKLPKCSLKYYIFDITMINDDNKIMRKIQIAQYKTLYSFAKFIVRSFGFDFDHCFGFYSNFDRISDSGKAYELFVDVREEPLSPKTKGVKKTKVFQVFKKPGDKMLFLFDYGDGWRFIVELKEIKNAEKWDLKPQLLESIGDAPPQYPPCKDEI